jgi:hypothetical protein
MVLCLVALTGYPSVPLLRGVKMNAEEIKGSAQGIHQSKNLAFCSATVHSLSSRAEKED